jgi:group I intron endonuclease
MVGIYKITNPKGRVYIGQSINIPKRFKYYTYGYSQKQRRLYNSLNKYGCDSHIFEVIEECDVKNLNERERFWQDKYDVLSKAGLNCELTSSLNGRRVLSEESKRKISEKNKGKNNGMYGHKHSKEFILQRRNYKHTKENLKKISKASQGENNPNSKTVLCLQSGIFYGCVGDAAKAINVSYDSLKQWLNGRRKNKSNMISV